MAFALTKLRTWGDKIQSATALRGTQVVELSITQLDTDVDCDIGDATGTFWTAAVADATYGDIATAALTQLLAIATQTLQILTVKSETLLPRLRDDSSPASTDYSLGINNHLPNIGFASGSAPTTWVLELDLRLDDGQFPVTTTIGS